MSHDAAAVKVKELQQQAAGQPGWGRVVRGRAVEWPVLQSKGWALPKLSHDCTARFKVQQAVKAVHSSHC
jgi:hypothetical protein